MIIKSYGLYLATFRLCRHPLLSALPSPPLQPAPVTLAKVPFLQVTAFRGPIAPRSFRHPPSRRLPYRRPAAHARGGACRASTKLGPPTPQSGIRRTCRRWWGRSKQERPRGGALGILVSRPGCSGPCRRPGARPGPALALLFFAGFCGTRSQRKARELACFFMTFQGSFHFPDRP